MDKRLMHYEFPRDQIRLEGTMAELPGKVAAVVEDSTDAAIVAAVLAAARAEGVTDLYLLDKTFILDAIREKLEREKPKPLTIEELQHMREQPVYVVPLPESCRDSNWEEWCVLGKDCAYIPGIEYWHWDLTDYNRTWIAYRHRPKEDPHGK